MQRRHDIDALRVFAFCMLILYHVGMVYVADWDFHIKSSYQADWLQWPMVFLNRWRMPLLFVISGVAIGLCRPERDPGRLALSRTGRLLLPLAFGMLLVVPIQAWCEARANRAFHSDFGTFLWRYLQMRPWPEGGWTGASSGVTWNHLWYLPYLWVYTICLLCFLPLLRTALVTRLCDWLGAQRGLMLVMPPALYLFAVLLWLAPRFPSNHSFSDDWALHAQYIPAFLFGYLVAHRDAFWAELVRIRRSTLAIALLAFTVELTIESSGLPISDKAVIAVSWMPWTGIELAARALYTWSALLTITGWGRLLLDRPFRWLPYASEAVYPWYILHQSLIVPIAFVVIPLHLGPLIEAGLVFGGTVVGCALVHELLIRRTRVLRPLFGLSFSVKAHRKHATFLSSLPFPQNRSNAPNEKSPREGISNTVT